MNIHVENSMEEFVIELLPKVIKLYPNMCTCDECLNDIVALALNNLKPRYVHTNKGDIYTRLNIYQLDSYTSVINALAQATQIVSQHPHHTKSTAEVKASSIANAKDIDANTNEQE